MLPGRGEETVFYQRRQCGCYGRPVGVLVLIAVKNEVAHTDLLQETSGLGGKVTDARCQRAIRSLGLADKALDEIAVGAGDESGVAVDQRFPVQGRPEHRLPVMAA